MQSYFSPVFFQIEKKKDNQEMVRFLNTLYQDQAPYYFQTWLQQSKTPSDKINLIAEMKNFREEKEGKFTPEYTQLRTQMIALVEQMKTWCQAQTWDENAKENVLAIKKIQHELGRLIPDSKTNTKGNLFNPDYLSDITAIQMLSDGKVYLEKLLFEIHIKDANLELAKTVVRNLTNVLAVCGPGIYVAMQEACMRYSDNLSELFLYKRTETLKQQAAKFGTTLNPKPRSGMEVHFAIFLANYVAADNGAEETRDEHAGISALPLPNEKYLEDSVDDQTVALLNDFKEYVNQPQTIDIFFEQLTAKFEEDLSMISNFTQAKAFEKTLDRLGVDPNYAMRDFFGAANRIESKRLQKIIFVNSEKYNENCRVLSVIYNDERTNTLKSVEQIRAAIKRSIFFRFLNQGMIKLSVYKELTIPGGTLHIWPNSFNLSWVHIGEKQVFLADYLQNLTEKKEEKALANIALALFQQLPLTDLKFINAYIPYLSLPLIQEYAGVIKSLLFSAYRINPNLDKSNYDNIIKHMKWKKEDIALLIRNKIIDKLTEDDEINFSGIDFSDMPGVSDLFGGRTYGELELNKKAMFKLDTIAYKALPDTKYLNRLDLTGVKFNEIKQSLDNKQFVGSILRNANFTGVSIHNTQFEDADLTGAIFSRSKGDPYFKKTTFDLQALQSFLQKELFFGSYHDIRGIIVEDNKEAKGITVSRCRINSPEIANCYQLGIRDFTHCHISRCDLKYLNLPEINFNNSSFTTTLCDFQGANLQGASFENVKFSMSPIFNEADLRKVSFKNCEINLFTDVRYSAVFANTIYDKIAPGLLNNYLKYCEGENSLITCKTFLEQKFLKGKTKGIFKPNPTIVLAVKMINGNEFKLIKDVKDFLNSNNIAMTETLEEIFAFCSLMEKNEGLWLRKEEVHNQRAKEGQASHTTTFTRAKDN